MPDIFLRQGAQNLDDITLGDPTVYYVQFTAAANSVSSTSATLDVLGGMTGAASATSSALANLTYISGTIVSKYATGAGWPDIFGNAKEAKVHRVTLSIRKRERSVVERVLDFLALPLLRISTSASMRVRTPFAAEGGIRSSAKATMRNHVRFEGKAGTVTTAHSDTMYVHVSREKFEKDLMEILMIDAA